MRWLTLIPVLSILTLLGGCSGIVKNMVNTQPRSTITQTELDHPDQIVKGRAVGYLPSINALNQIDESKIDPDIVRYAPVLIQGFQPNETQHHKYTITDDAIGSPYITANGQKTKINTDQPTIYWQIEHATVKNQPLKQLVYVFWYPRRPVGSIETGAVDGGILRITLNTEGRPAVYEYAQTCGCYHGVFVSKKTEQYAQTQYASIEPNREHAVEPAITGGDDWIVRDIIDTQPNTRPVLFLSAGKHFLVDIASLPEDRIQSITANESKAYQLASYKILDNAPREGGGTGSIFNNKGLVKGAKRGNEELVLGDLDHPGWPRRLSKMHIHWDKDEWNDPSLLASHLRLPDAIFSNQTNPMNAIVEQTPSQKPQTIDTMASNSTTPDLHTQSSQAQDHQMLLFTDARCSGCQLTKQIIKNSSEIHQAIGNWNFTIIDTATDEGAKIAAEHRISLVPTLVGFDHNQELMRSNELESKSTILRAINQITHAFTNIHHNN